MGDPRVNRYRSGVKNPHREVIVAETTDGETVAHVVDWAHGRIVSLKETPGGESPEVDQGQNLAKKELKNG